MKRRDMLKATGGAAVAASGVPALLGCSATPPAGDEPRGANAKDKRQLVLDLLDEGKAPGYVPAGFFIHFGEDEHVGQPAIDKHTEYFRFTGMDFVKIQYEAGFPPHPEIETPEDWDACVDEMIAALEIVAGDDFEMYNNTARERAQRGINLMAEHFFNLWD